MNSSPLEIYIETKSVEKSEKLGYLNVKMSRVRRGWPDRMFLNLFGFQFYIEFKKEGEEPYPLQWHWIKELRRHKILVFVVDNLPDALLILEGMYGEPAQGVGTQELSGKGYTVDAQSGRGWFIS